MLALAAAGAMLALGLEPERGIRARSSASRRRRYEATQTLHRRFGDDAIVVSVREPVAHLVLTQDLNTALGLEGCLGGNVPAGREAGGGASGPARGSRGPSRPASCSGPGRSSTRSVEQIADGLAQLTARQQQRHAARRRAAEKLALASAATAGAGAPARKQAEQVSNAKFLTELLKLAVRYGLGHRRAAADGSTTEFVSQLVFDPRSRRATSEGALRLALPEQETAR